MSNGDDPNSFNELDREVGGAESPPPAELPRPPPHSRHLAADQEAVSAALTSPDAGSHSRTLDTRLNPNAPIFVPTFKVDLLASKLYNDCEYPCSRVAAISLLLYPFSGPLHTVEYCLVRGSLLWTPLRIDLARKQPDTSGHGDGRRGGRDPAAAGGGRATGHECRGRVLRSQAKENNPNRDEHPGHSGGWATAAARATAAAGSIGGWAERRAPFLQIRRTMLRRLPAHVAGLDSFIHSISIPT